MTCERCGGEVVEDLKQPGRHVFCKDCLFIWVLIQETRSTFEANANDYHKKMYADIEEWWVNAMRYFKEIYP